MVVAAPAHAQAPPYASRPYYPPPYYPPRYAAWPVPVTIASDTPGTRFSIKRDQDAAEVARCDTRCGLYLPKGKYRLVVKESDDVADGTRRFKLDGPSSILLSPDTPGQRWAGLSLGIGGIAATIAGAVLLLSSNGCADCGEATKQKAGVVLLLGGLGATPVGWVMFGKSFKPDLQIDQRSAAVHGSLRF